MKKPDGNANEGGQNDLLWSTGQELLLSTPGIFCHSEMKPIQWGRGSLSTHKIASQSLSTSFWRQSLPFHQVPGDEEEPGMTQVSWWRSKNGCMTVEHWNNKDLLSVSSLCMSNSRVPYSSCKWYFLLLNVCFTQWDNSCCAKWELLSSLNIILPSTACQAPVCLLMLLFQLVSKWIFVF